MGQNGVQGICVPKGPKGWTQAPARIQKRTNKKKKQGGKRRKGQYPPNQRRQGDHRRDRQDEYQPSAMKLVQHVDHYCNECQHDLTGLQDHYCPCSHDENRRMDHHCDCGHEFARGDDHWCPCPHTLRRGFIDEEILNDLYASAYRRMPGRTLDILETQTSEIDKSLMLNY